MEHYSVNSIEEYHERELSFMRMAATAGNMSAVLEALRYCSSNKIEMPRWILEFSYHLIVAGITGKMKKGRGRANNPFARHAQDLVHFLRYDTVLEIRDRQDEIARELKCLEGETERPDLIAHYQALHKAIGRSWEDAYVAAHRVLRHSLAFGSPDTMAKSYKLVVKSHRSPEERGRFRLASDQVLRDLGLAEVLNTERWGKKFLDLLLSED